MNLFCDSFVMTFWVVLATASTKSAMALTMKTPGQTTASTAATTPNNNDNKGICETTITNDGQAEIMCTSPNLPKTPVSLWTEVAIQAAKQFTITQRQKLQDLGALDIQRPIQIVGEPLTENCNLGDCTLPSTDKTVDGDDNDGNTKVIHFQRHGQGYHNLICDMWRELGRPIDFDSTDPNLNPVVRPEFLDPPLTALGMQQCSSQRPLCSMLTPELVIVSPMLRCIQTAKLSFRDHTANVPWVSHEGCREELGLLVGNKRRPISEIQVDYPEMDFSPIEYDEDLLWEEYDEEMRRETLIEKSERIYDFLTEYVKNRPEKEIAIVCHSAYLFTLLNAVMDIDDEELRNWFLTSEVRSLKMTFKER